MQFIVPAVIVCLGALLYYLYMNYIKKDEIKGINNTLNKNGPNIRADIKDVNQSGQQQRPGQGQPQQRPGPGPGQGQPQQRPGPGQGQGQQRPGPGPGQGQPQQRPPPGMQ